jgi:Flp pilus assembly protein TadG
MLEFTMVAIPVIFVTMSILEASIESWEYHSMAYAIEMACRFACAHGRTCTKNSNTCTIEVKDVISVITNQAPMLDTSKLVVTLTGHTSSVSCNPVSSCTSNATQFPTSTDNGVGSDIKIVATYPMSSPLPMMWFGSSSTSGSTWTLGATTRQTIVY